jgi:hypothetical protein
MGPEILNSPIEALEILTVTSKPEVNHQQIGVAKLNALIQIISQETMRLSGLKTLTLQRNISVLLSQLDEDGNDCVRTSSAILQQLNVARPHVSGKILYLD